MTRAVLRVEERVILFARLSSVTVGGCGMQYTEINDGSCPGCTGAADGMEEREGELLGSVNLNPWSLTLPLSRFPRRYSLPSISPFLHHLGGKQPLITLDWPPPSPPPLLPPPPITFLN